MARWRNGYAADCKSVYTGSIPVRASIIIKIADKDVTNMVMGAEIFDVLKLLVWQFSKPVLIANIIAWPVAYLMMSQWLESFVYRIDDIAIIAVCLIAGLCTMLIAWATVPETHIPLQGRTQLKL